MVEANEIGRRLAVLRGSEPREETAKAVGVSVSAISMYENGDRIPRDGIKVNFANHFGRSVQEIFFDEDCHIT